MPENIFMSFVKTAVKYCILPKCTGVITLNHKKAINNFIAKLCFNNGFES